MYVYDQKMIEEMRERAKSIVNSIENVRTLLRETEYEGIANLVARNVSDSLHFVFIDNPPPDYGGIAEEILAEYVENIRRTAWKLQRLAMAIKPTEYQEFFPTKQPLSEVQSALDFISALTGTGPN